MSSYCGVERVRVGGACARRALNVTFGENQMQVIAARSYGYLVVRQQPAGMPGRSLELSRVFT